jgi:hypothetical protein
LSTPTRIADEDAAADDPDDPDDPDELELAAAEGPDGDEHPVASTTPTATATLTAPHRDTDARA